MYQLAARCRRNARVNHRHEQNLEHNIDMRQHLSREKKKERATVAAKEYELQVRLEKADATTAHHLRRALEQREQAAVSLVSLGIVGTDGKRRKKKLHGGAHIYLIRAQSHKQI